LTITKEGAVLKGKIASEQYGPQDLTDLKFENDVLTYTRNLDLGGQVIAMAFKGKIDGDKLTGTYDIMGLELPVTGTRKAAANPAGNKCGTDNCASGQQTVHIHQRGRLRSVCCRNDYRGLNVIFC